MLHYKHWKGDLEVTVLFDVHPLKPSPKKPMKLMWVKPPRGILKLNIDGAFNDAWGGGALGVFFVMLRGVLLWSWASVCLLPPLWMMSFSLLIIFCSGVTPEISRISGRKLILYFFTAWCKAKNVGNLERRGVPYVNG
ncbi:hypothetical protein LIER_26903 [Lithospermum erythrorhizon]|uniref:Uncharacterized protein n=1 Tax=Lithospermum erythrorhizon TaxID=34254 RepID=A0AAV3RFW2_LITER